MNNNDKKIFELKKKLERKKIDLGKKPVVQFKTNCIFSLFGVNYNLHAMNEFELGILMGWLKNLNPETKMNSNFTVDDYVFDISGKMILIDYNRKIKEINNLESKLDDLISSETKTSIEIDKLAKQIE